MKMLGDYNEKSFTLTRDLQSQKQTKHIDVIYHHIYGLEEDKKLAIKQIKNSTMFTDTFTKALPTGLFKKHQDE